MPFALRFPREKEWFTQAARLLGMVRADPRRLDLVLELQQLLIRRIARSELRHARLADARLRLKAHIVRERLIGERAHGMKKLVLKIQDRFDELAYLRFLYRCFGDGIAAIYHPPIHHRYFYFGERALAKERPRHLSGNAALGRSYRALRLGIGIGVPTVLVDVTNMLGQGDICVLAGREPQPMDLASFGRPARPGTRWRDDLRHAMRMVAGHGPGDVRGLLHPVPQAQALHSDAVHSVPLEDCVRRAMEGGMAVVSPEPGLRYVAVRSGYLDQHPGSLQALRGQASKSTMSMQVSPQMSWVPMQPFSLSLVPAHAVLFMQGGFELIVYIDLQVLKSHFAALGVHAVALMDGVTALQICRDPEDLAHGAYRVSEAIFQRICCEFMPLRSFAQEMAGMLEPAGGRGLHDADEGGTLFAPPPDWAQVRDYYEEEGPLFH